MLCVPHAWWTLWSLHMQFKRHFPPLVSEHFLRQCFSKKKKEKKRKKLRHMHDKMVKNELKLANTWSHHLTWDSSSCRHLMKSIIVQLLEEDRGKLQKVHVNSAWRPCVLPITWWGHIGAGEGGSLASGGGLWGPSDPPYREGPISGSIRLQVRLLSYSDVSQRTKHLIFRKFISSFSTIGRILL